MRKLLLSLTLLVSSSAYADPAFWTNDFIAQIGVNAHLDQRATDPNYPVQLAAALKATGIRLLRTSSTGDPGTAIMVNLAAAVPGLKYDVITARMHGDTSTGLLVNWQRWTNLFNAGALYALEGPNEPNNAGAGYAVDRPDGSFYAGKCGNTAPASWLYCAEFQRDFYTLVHTGFMGAGPFPGVVVYGPSETGANPKSQWYGVALNTALDPARMAGLTPYVTSTWPDTATAVIGTQFSDFVNTHNYASGNSSHTYQDNFAWLSMQPNDPVTGLNIVGIDGWYQEHENGFNGATGPFPNPNGWFGYAAAEAPSIPSVTTETSWQITDRTLTTPVGTGAKNVDQTTQGYIALDLYLDYFSQWGKLGAGAGGGMLWYEMFGFDGSSSDQGLYPAYSPTGTLGPPTPAVTFISNMISIFTDTGPRPSLGTLSYTVTDKAGSCAATDPSSTVHTQLFQKGTKFLIAIWDERSSNLPNSGDTATITFGDGLNHSWQYFDPTVKATFISTGGGTSIGNIALSNHPKFYLLTK